MSSEDIGHYVTVILKTLLLKTPLFVVRMILGRRIPDLEPTRSTSENLST